LLFAKPQLELAAIDVNLSFTAMEPNAIAGCMLHLHAIGIHISRAMFRIGLFRPGG
jgi:hypothetical protein